MSDTKLLLDSLLGEIYGHQQRRLKYRHKRTKAMSSRSLLPKNHNLETLQELDIMKLIDISAILKLEIRLMGHFLESVLISRDRIRRHQEVLCGFVDAILHVECHDAHARMRFSLSPPPQKAISSNESSRGQRTGTSPSNLTSPTYRYNNNTVMQRTPSAGNDIRSPVQSATSSQREQDAADAASDYNQWLHAMKLVARLPGGMPPEFRRKLWLSLADKYLKSKNVDWSKEEEKCFCEKWREDDEELGIQIVKDLHRTGSNLCTGPAGNINQAKLKRILLGYARYNPEVGYCQGFNMLGALILQVMDKEESESIKVMIYLVEGVLPSGYFCGSMGGLQADMGVFRELMQTKLPRLAKHLQKLQGPIENAYEPPLTNVFTMQWFLTLFCTCLPMTCVLRVWDLILIEGSDVLLRTALVLWSLLEERVLKARTADDFYGKMGSFSSELLNGHLIDSNGLIEKVVQLGAIPDIQKLRDKHLYNIAPLRHKQSMQLYFDDEEPESDEDSRLAVASVWGIPWGRRGSHSQTITKQLSTTTIPTANSDSRDRLALDISLLKKQYDRLRERQKQAHIILTTACSTSPRPSVSSTSTSPVPVNQLLMGRPAIMTNKGRRPPPGAIPPARKPSLPTILQTKPLDKQLRRGETINWRDMDPGKKRRDSLTWKEIKADRKLMLREGSESSAQSNKLRSRFGKSDSSSYSEESDEDGEGSSTDTSLCDEDDPKSTGDKTLSSSVENSPKRRLKSSRRQKELSSKLLELNSTTREQRSNERPKSWAPSSNKIPFMLMTSDSPVNSGDEKGNVNNRQAFGKCIQEEDSNPECDRLGYKRVKELDWSDTNYSPIAGDLATRTMAPLHIQTDILELPVITSTSQLSPMPDISGYLNNSTISPLPTPKPLFVDSTNSLGSGDGDDRKKFDVNDDGVTNQYFERVNSVERPTNLELFYSLNEEDNIRLVYNDENKEGKEAEIEEKQNVRDRPLDRALKVVFIGEESKKTPEVCDDSTQKLPEIPYERKFLDSEYTYEDSDVFDPTKHTRDDNIPGENRDDFDERQAKPNEQFIPKPIGLSKKQSVLNANKKRRDPRRLTRSSTIEIEERFQALEKHLSIEESFKAVSNESPKCMQSPTHIPSTAELEKRYNTLEKQLSLSKDNCQRVCTKPSQPEPSHEVDVLIRPERKRIPSAADLENRYDALARQMSSSSGNAKESLDLKGDDSAKEMEKNQDDKPLKDIQNEESTGSKTRETTIKSESSEKTEIEEDKSPPTQRLKKLPSTAELEDRFNALERKMSTQNSSPSKSKKEPPDDGSSEKKPESGERNENEESIHMEKKSTGDVKNKTAKKEVKNNQKEINKSLRDNTNKKKDDRKEDLPGAQVETSTKKLPPSTEELEKRFQALEKQLSSTSIEGVKGKPSTDEENRSDQEDVKTNKSKKTEGNVQKDAQNNQMEIQSADSKEKCSSKAESPKIASKGNQSVSDAVEPKNSMKSFEEKCKSVNMELSEKSSTTENNTTHTEIKSSKSDSDASKASSMPKTRETFTEKVKSINKQLEVNMDESNTDNETTIQGPSSQQSESAKRRASEPPSTEDLERRYETLKRQLSTKTLNDKNSGKRETVEEAMERIEKKVIEENVEFSNAEDKETTRERTNSKPPSTENLEKRFEALQRQSSTMSDDMVSKKAGNKSVSLGQSTTKVMKTTSEDSETTTTKELPAPKKHLAKVETSKSVQTTTPPDEKHSHIPDAPPMPEFIVRTDPASQHQRRALIDELQKKMKTQPNDENLKPSAINPNRKSPQCHRSARADATPETHADSAFYRSGNYEPWQTTHSPHRMVRRFSDLPSRADLENRVQFLEKQLIKKLYKQRCASDSEVTSRMYFADTKVPGKTHTHEMPSTSAAAMKEVLPESDLEKRVLLLEKQLSENSLKLLEAIRAGTFESPQKTGLDSESLRKLSTETVDATGKELVRYTQFGEVDETNSHKPINISINIKMLLNKEGEEKMRTEPLPTTEELEKRLEMLEQQLKVSKPRLSSSAEREEFKEEQVAVEASEDEVFLEDCEYQEQESDNAVQNLETRSTQQAINHEKVETEKVDENQVKEVEKENETIETQEIVKNTGTHCKEELKPSQEQKQPGEKETENNAEAEPEGKSKDNQDLSDQHLEPPCSASTESEIKSIDKSSETPKKAETPKDLPDNVVLNSAELAHVDPNNKTVLLLLDNEPKALKVRRLTRANTEELEGLFEALEKQLSSRNLVKTEDGKLKRADTKEKENADTQPSEESKALSELTKEIEKFTTDEESKDAKSEPKKLEEAFDWGPDPVKRHLKRKTVHLPSTKELEARFRSLERQIKLLEDVEKIDVEQRLNEIERKIKLQYSLSHEKDLSKFLELCEGKGLDDPIVANPPPVNSSNSTHKCECECPKSPHTKSKSPYTSPSRSRSRTPHTSPTRSKSQARSKSPARSHSPARSQSINRGQSYDDEGIPRTEDLEYRFRALDLPRSKSKENLKKKIDAKKQPIHPLEMLLDPSPDDSEIPTTGELEHRMRMLNEKRITPSPPPQARNRSRSPTIDDIKRKKLLDEQRPKTPIHTLETMVTSPTKRELPTEEELEARVRALEKDHKFDFKMQKNYMEFNQKLRDVISPSLSFEEFKTSKSREESPQRSSEMRSSTPKSALRDSDSYARRDESSHYRSTSPKVIRFSDDEDYRPRSRTELRDTGRMVGNLAALEQIQENSKLLHRILEKTLVDCNSSIYGSSAALAEGLDEMGSRLMRETSPLQRTGTHTGVPLRTNDNINERLSSIKETIKSIDSLCEEKPYRKEKCQRYIDSLFSDSIHFASKKSSLEDLHSRSSRSPSRYGHREYAPSIRISDHSQRPSEHYLSRSIGSAESLRSTSPLGAALPLHHRSTRDLRREISPRRRIDEEREEYESRVRRAHMLPNYILNDYSDLSSGSLIKFHKVDRQPLDTYERERSSSRSASRSPLKLTYGSRETMMMSHNNNNNNHNTTTNTNDSYTKTDTPNTTTRTAHITNRLDLDRPVSPYRQTSHNLLGYDTSPQKRSSTSVYNPAKLEIRHTTVTSTFYDRLLTEKQIEKNLTLTPSRSPVISPSGLTKNYLDLTATNAATSPNTKSKDSSPTTSATAQLNSFMGINASLGIGAGSGNMSATAYTATNTQKTVSATQSNSYSFNATGNLSSIQNTPLTRLPPHVATASDDPAQNDLRIRSCENILMQLKSTYTSTPASPASGAANDTAVSIPSLLHQRTPMMGTSASSGTAMSYNFSSSLPSGYNNSRSATTLLTFSSIAPIITSTTTTTSTNSIASASIPLNTSAFTSNSSTFNAPSQQPRTEIGTTPIHLFYSSTLGSNASNMPK